MYVVKVSVVNDATHADAGPRHQSQGHAYCSDRVSLHTERWPGHTVVLYLLLLKVNTVLPSYSMYVAVYCFQSRTNPTISCWMDYLRPRSSPDSFFTLYVFFIDFFCSLCSTLILPNNLSLFLILLSFDYLNIIIQHETPKFIIFRIFKN